MNNNITDSVVINKSNKIYFITTTDRYIWYLILWMTNMLIGNLLFGADIFAIKFLFLFSTIPELSNYLSQTYLKDFFTTINNIKINLIGSIYIDQISGILQEILKHYDNRIDKNDIVDFVSNFNINNHNLYKYIENILVCMILTYLRNYNIAYYKISKYLYYVGSGNYFVRKDSNPMVAESEARSHILYVIQNKKYEDMNSQVFVQNVFYLYGCKSNTISFKHILVRVNYKIMTMMTIWVIGSLMTNIYLIIISICMTNQLIIWVRQHKNIVWKDYLINAFISIATTFIALSQTDMIPILCMVCVFASDLINNNMMKKMCHTIQTKLVWLISKYQQITRINSYDVLRYGVALSLYYVGLYVGVIETKMFYPSIILAIIDKNHIYIKLINLLTLFGIYNNMYNLINILIIAITHMMLISIMYYKINFINIYQLDKTNRPNIVSANTLETSLILPNKLNKKNISQSEVIISKNKNYKISMIDNYV